MPAMKARLLLARQPHGGFFSSKRRFTDIAHCINIGLRFNLKETIVTNISVKIAVLAISALALSPSAFAFHEAQPTQPPQPPAQPTELTCTLYKGFGSNEPSNEILYKQTATLEEGIANINSGWILDGYVKISGSYWRKRLRSTAIEVDPTGQSQLGISTEALDLGSAKQAVLYSTFPGKNGTSRVAMTLKCELN